MLLNTTLPGQWAIVVGFFLPPLLSTIFQSYWPKQTKTALGFLACAIVSLIGLAIEGRLSGENLFPTLLLTLVTSISTFEKFWKPLGLDKWEKSTDLEIINEHNNDDLDRRAIQSEIDDFPIPITLPISPLYRDQHHDVELNLSDESRKLMGGR